MKKGFTLVELAIVLVIIGLIMGMSIKGKALIDVAKIRGELAKLGKIEAATAIYVAKSARAEAPDGINNLTDRGYISEADITSQMSAKQVYTLQRCTAKTILNGTVTVGDGYEYDIKSDDRCAYLPVMNQKLACNIENIIDDQNADSGVGRVFKTTFPGTAKQGDFEVLTASTETSAALKDLYENCDNNTTVAKVFAYGYTVY